jgi:hypothetical protein
MVTARIRRGEYPAIIKNVVLISQAIIGATAVLGEYI